MASDLELIYFSDPMCSWCWGFEPVMRRLKSRFESEIVCSTVMGGLFPGDSPPLNEAFRNMIQSHWREVEEKTGQPFDFENAAPLGLVYNTEPPSRALVVVRSLKAESEFEYLWALQKAFYQQAQDLSDPQLLANIASEFGIGKAEFMTRFESPTIKMATRMDFQLAREIQARAFPCIVLRSGHDYTFVTIGYQDYETLEPMILKWLGNHQAA